MKKTSSLFLFAVFCTIGSLIGSFNASASSTVYRWVDEKGVTHFGKQPPPTGTSHQTIKTRETSTQRPSPDESLSPRSSKNEENKVPDEYSKQLQKLAQQNDDSCQRSKTNKQTLLNNHRVRLQGSDGNARVLSHEEKLQELQKADEAIKAFCE